MTPNFPFSPSRARIAFAMEDYYIWDCSVIYAEGRYHMFSSRWPKKYGFGWNWLFNSEIVHAVSDTPEGPYTFVSVVLERRGREYFDGMNTHNTCIKAYGGKYYLYYMGTTYSAEVPHLRVIYRSYRFPRSAESQLMDWSYRCSPNVQHRAVPEAAYHGGHTDR